MEHADARRTVRGRARWSRVRIIRWTMERASSPRLPLSRSPLILLCVREMSHPPAPNNLRRYPWSRRRERGGQRMKQRLRFSGHKTRPRG
jgi:hypothetical protein